MLTGTDIEWATFLVDGRRHGSLTRPNAGRAWVATIPTRSLSVGTHAVAVRVVFTAASGNGPRLLTVGVRRCVPQRPRFTG